MNAIRDVIILVDDDRTNLAFGKSCLSDDYDVFTAPSGKKLFALLEKVSPALILLDIEMPEMDGHEVIRALKGAGKSFHIPVIFLTAAIDPESEVKGLHLGAVDYITKPFSRELLIKRVNLHILFERQKKELMRYSLNLESEVDKKGSSVFELQTTILKTVAELVECRDNITGGHIERTQHYLSLLAGILLKHNVYAEEVSSWDIDLLIMSSQLHDVGKISIKDEILLKPGKLSPDEFEEMKKHAAMGADIIRKIEGRTSENEFLHYAEVLAGSHHEKWDGSGYPYGLKSHDIPLLGRLMAIVDVYDALTNERPYKKAFTHEEALRIIKDGSGKQFDPAITEVFLMHEKEFLDAKSSGNFTRDAHGGARDRLHPAIKMVANIVGLQGRARGGHIENKYKYLTAFMDALLAHGCYRDEVKSWGIDSFLFSAQLHDIGKIAVPFGMLNKSEELTEEEFEKVKAHADFGAKIVREIHEKTAGDSLLRHAEALAGSHHEKWDGTGYPLGLKGDAIPLQGRIMSIVDVYEALVSDRPHRERKTHKEAVEIIRSGSGKHFDPKLVDVFLENEKKFEAVGSEGRVNAGIARRIPAS